jgi:hypothetical protein
MRFLKTFAILLPICLIIAGCKWMAATPIPASQKTRALYPGDIWLYQVSGHPSDVGAVAGVASANGAFLVKVDTAPSTSSEHAYTAVLVQSSVLTSGDQTSHVTTKRYVAQDASGTIWLMGTESKGETEWINNAEGYVCDFPSPISVGETWDVKEKVGDAIVLEYRCKVVGTELVTVPAGLYEAYKIEREAVQAPTGNITQWYAPEISACVKETIEGTDKDLTLKYKRELMVVQVHHDGDPPRN